MFSEYIALVFRVSGCQRAINSNIKWQSRSIGRPTLCMVICPAGLYTIHSRGLNRAETNRDRDRYTLLEQDKTGHSSWKCLYSAVWCGLSWVDVLVSSAAACSPNRKSTHWEKKTLTHCQEIGLTFLKRERERKREHVTQKGKELRVCWLVTISI